MEKNKQDDKEIKKPVISDKDIDTLLNNEVIKPKIDAEVEKRSEEKSQLLYKRQEFLNTVNAKPIDDLQKYRSVNENGYNNLKMAISNLRNDISNSTLEQLRDIEGRIQYAYGIEEELKSRLSTFDTVPVTAHREKGGVPESLNDILGNEDLYRDSIDRHMKKGDKSLSIYKTQLDDEVVDVALLGNREDRASVREMNRLEQSLEEVLDRNAKYRHFQKIR